MKKILFFTTCFILFNFVFLLSNDRNDNCFTIIAGKNTNPNGAVLIAHNEDDGGENFFVDIHRIKSEKFSTQIPLKLKNGALYFRSKTEGLLWLEIRGTEFADSYINENGVVIVSNACSSREDKGDLTNGGIGTFLRRIIAEQAKSAKEAVILAGKLVDRFGYYSSGRSYAFADRNEGWFFQIVKGKHWIAQRVPDNEVAIVPNYYTIGEIDLSDKENFLASKDIVTYAIERGWYSPEEDGKFNFRKVYSQKKNLTADYNYLRHWRGIKLLSKLNLHPRDKLPFSFRPSGIVKIVKLFEVLRDHYEGTIYDLTNKYKTGSPNFTKKRTICTKTTQYSIVGKLRGNLPVEIAAQIWISFRRPDSNSFSPWYPTINSVPTGYTRINAQKALTLHFNKDRSYFTSDTIHPFWNYAKLSNMVDRNYRKNHKIVRKMWKNFENFLLRDIKKQEKEFMYIYKKNKLLALNIISGYVQNMEYRRWLKTLDLLNSIR